MKRIFTLLAFFSLLITRASTIGTGVPCPDGDAVSTSIVVEIPTGALTNFAARVFIEGDDLYYEAGNPWGAILQQSHISFSDKPLGLSHKTGILNKDKFILYWPDGTYRIYLATVTTIPNIDLTCVDSGQVILPVLSGGLNEIKGDALYCDYGGYLGTNRSGTWAWDTIGLPTGGGGFDLDSTQNLYVINGQGLFFQTTTGNSFSKVTAYPGQGGNTILIDNKNRIIISNNTTVYIGTNNGTNWTSSIIPAIPSRFGEDAFGNIYGVCGNRAYRSLDGGMTWTRIDQPITSLALDTTIYGIINSINGDSLIYAATIFGGFVSSDQGSTWQPANRGKQSVPNGFWLYNNGRMVANTGLGTFIKNATDTAWTQTFPTGGKYLNMGSIQGDTLGNIYTILSMYSGQVQTPMKSSDQGATWQPDTAGVAQVPYINYHAYYVDEYGTSHLSGGSNGQLLLYNKVSAGSYVLDTAGIGVQMPNFGDILTYCSDHNGYLYMSGHNYSNLSIWRRPVAGGTWVPDTAGLGSVYFTLSNYDSHNGVIALNWVSNGLYHRNAMGWKNIAYPTTVYSFSTPSGIAGDPSGGLISAFYTPNYTTGINTPYGIYCTHDEGATWTYVPGLDSTYVNSAETFGDTTYLLTTHGIYKMTCNGVVVDTIPDTTSGIRNINVDGIKLYPNPTTGECHISLNSSITDGTLIIQDLMGRAVKTVTLSIGETTFQTRDMNAGLYICTISSGGKVISTRKLVVN